MQAMPHGTQEKIPRMVPGTQAGRHGADGRSTGSLGVAPVTRDRPMTSTRGPTAMTPPSSPTEGFAGAIFDGDGVLVDSPHERAWRESLRRLMEGDWRALAPRTRYTPDALAFLLATKHAGLRIACASSSRNTRAMLERIRLDKFAVERGLRLPEVREGLTLLDAFDADVTGRDFPRGKPDPMIFLAAAEDLRLPPERCVVIEDALSGVQAAKAGGMAAIGVARQGGAEVLWEAGADLVVGGLDEVDVDALTEGRLGRR